MKQIEKTTIIIDIGTGFIKSGFGGDEIPISIIPTIIGKKKSKGIIMGTKNEKQYFIGNDAISNYGILETKFPIEHNIIIDRDSIETIFEFIINNELTIKPEEFNFIFFRGYYYENMVI